MAVLRYTALACFSMSWQTIMSRFHDNEDGCFVAMDTEDDGAETAGITEEGDAKMGSCHQAGDPDSSAKGEGRRMTELPEEVLEYILSFLSPYQEHKTAALVCKQWYRLIKGKSHDCMVLKTKPGSQNIWNVLKQHLKKQVPSEMVTLSTQNSFAFLFLGVAYQCYHGFLRAVQEGNIQWESRTYPYPGTPITQRFSHSQ